jgi:hypothetical protein
MKVIIKKDNTGITVTPKDGVSLEAIEICKKEFYRKNYDYAEFTMCGNGIDIAKQYGELFTTG